MNLKTLITAGFCLVFCSVNQAQELEWIRVSDDGKQFVFQKSNARFIAWGFNYDHDGQGRLIEDYWDDEWSSIESDFREMKDLGANVVRVHLQFSKFMKGPSRPDHASLRQLSRLLKLAEETKLYLDVTGLGCYHKKDVPSWYDNLGEAARWEAQAIFWEQVAKTCADSPAVFCYDLMNEPVVPGGDKRRTDWLGPGFGDKHFVQFISLERKKRDRVTIAKSWIERLHAAIRKHDKRHLVTVGLVPWSLDRPGLTSGFVPEKICDKLDFVSLHIYPEKGKIDQAMETVRAFAEAGKPVVIEEMFVLKCGAKELGDFIDRSRKHVNGWMGFYWGKTPDEYQQGKSIADAMTLSWLKLFQEKREQVLSAQAKIDTDQPRDPYVNAKCEGSYRHHLQGICVDGKSIYWSFTTTLVKTDLRGKLLKKVPVANHHGDLCFHQGKLYVAVNLGKFNDPKGNADSWVYVYDAKDLKLSSKHETQQVVYGAGGIGFRDGHFYVVGGLPDSHKQNYVYHFDRDFQFIKRHDIQSGHTHLGIQTATFTNGRWYFGCYGAKQILLVTDDKFKMKGRFEYDCSLGIEGIPGGRLLSASGSCPPSGCVGKVQLAIPDDQFGLKLLTKETDQ